MECKLTENQENCMCANDTCRRYGICCDCLAAHLEKQGLPRCFFPPEPKRVEHGRNFEGFAKSWGLI